MRTVTIRLFGAFRKYVPSGEVDVDVDGIHTVGELKRKITLRIQELSPGFSDMDLISESVLANAVEVLADNAQIEAEDQLAFLPPVCGG